MDVLALHALLEHADPKIVIFEQEEVLVAARGLDVALLVHDAGMVEGIALFGEGEDLGLMRGDAAAGVDVLDGIGEFLDGAADEAELGMVGKDLELALAAVGTADVVGVHARDELVAAGFDAGVERAAEALILCEAQDVEPPAETLLHLGDGLVELRSQRAVADEDEVVGRHGLAVDALHALAQVVRLFLIVDGHQYGVLLHDSFPAPFRLLVFLCGR